MHVSRKTPRSLLQYSLAVLTALISLMNPLSAATADAPVISVQPATQIALIGTNPYLSVSATGGASLSYAWKKDGAAIAGATSSELVLKNAAKTVAGNYTVTVSNAAGNVTSTVATLYMVAPAAANPPPLPSIPDTVFNVTKYGAKADGVSDSTAAIQATIDAAIAANGGIVKFPAAEKPYRSGPLVIGSNINLQIDGGATLQLLPLEATDSTPAYPTNGTRYANFISGANVHNFAITGQGVIDGGGQPWWGAFRSNPNMSHRPFLVSFSRCDQVLVQGIKMINSPMFHLAFSGNNVTVVGLAIQAPGNSPNTDAIDPGGEHILIQNCYLSIGDDNIAVKASGTHCADLTIANLTVGEGHGVSVGGQSNAGLDGMVVKDCVFNGTVSGLRLKADATEGGMVQNITYSNLTMTNVQYPIVFYSYYKPVGNPGATSGANKLTPENVTDWNAAPPNSLHSRALSGWRNITINNLTSTGAQAYNVIWGLPLPDYLIANVTLNNVHLSGGPGFEIFDATNVQVTGDSDIGPITTGTALIIVKQPANQTVKAGGDATFSVTTAGDSGKNKHGPNYQWNFNGKPLTDGASVSGATTSTLKISNAKAAQAGSYTVTVTNKLDGYDLNTDALAPDSIPVSATSSAATLTVQ